MNPRATFKRYERRISDFLDTAPAFTRQSLRTALGISSIQCFEILICLKEEGIIDENVTTGTYPVNHVFHASWAAPDPLPGPSEATPDLRKQVRVHMAPFTDSLCALLASTTRLTQEAIARACGLKPAKLQNVTRRLVHLGILAPTADGGWQVVRFGEYEQAAIRREVRGQKARPLGNVGWRNVVRVKNALEKRPMTAREIQEATSLKHIADVYTALKQMLRQGTAEKFGRVYMAAKATPPPAPGPAQ
jgi:hypothetical protein